MQERKEAKEEREKFNILWSTRRGHIGIETLERKRSTNKAKRIQEKRNNSLTKRKSLKEEVVNLSTVELTHSETNLLQRGLNFCPTPPPPKPESVDKDIDAFARRINLKEYHAPDDTKWIKNQCTNPRYLRG